MTGIRSLSAVSRRAFATLVAAVAVAVVTLSPGAAFAIDDAHRITQLTVTIVTGGDDLRTASNAVASFRYTNTSGNQLVTSFNLNNGVSWPNSSTKTVTFATPAGIYQGLLLDFAIQFTSGQPDIFSTGDNWNMNAITVTARMADGSNVILVSQAGSPLHRFQSDTNTRWVNAF
ncbi:hypothetical protein [Corallococcus terminator]|uniref:Uncharacterized protein n=1 Tax=Corallococcus terminator TaxID=2316733 RepID=A0A3A8JLW8_9BACT|nr:hypothetical protein [Corallococcus terminator]RKG90513.1 hypothetical protein D7V88_10945 [Corallococcus terminator]